MLVGNIWIFVISLFTLFNISISAYMSYHTIDIAVKKCKCAITAYWYIIVIYFLASGCFLIYTMLVVTGLVSTKYFMILMIVYLLATFLFSGGSIAYTKYLTSSKDCNCVTSQYMSLLKIIGFFRLLTAITSLVALLSWGVYVLFVRYY